MQPLAVLFVETSAEPGMVTNGADPTHRGGRSTEAACKQFVPQARSHPSTWFESVGLQAAGERGRGAAPVGGNAGPRQPRIRLPLVRFPHPKTSPFSDTKTRSVFWSRCGFSR